MGITFPWIVGTIRLCFREWIKRMNHRWWKRLFFFPSTLTFSLHDSIILSSVLWIRLSWVSSVSKIESEILLLSIANYLDGSLKYIFIYSCCSSWLLWISFAVITLYRIPISLELLWLFLQLFCCFSIRSIIVGKMNDSLLIKERKISEDELLRR